MEKEEVNDIVMRWWKKLPTCNCLKDLGVWKKDVGLDEIRKLIRNLKNKIK